MSRPPLSFGTDGWRGVIAEDATFDTFRRLARAAAASYREGRFGPGDRSTIAIGHDPRFLSEDFSRAAAEVFAQAGIGVALTDRPIPTPAVSAELRRRGLSGGIAVTASHNPARYNGFKLKASFGGSAPPSLYDVVERDLDAPFSPALLPGKIAVEDFETPYREALGARVDLGAIRAAGFRVVADAMHGAAGDGLAAIVGKGKTRIESFRAQRDVLFGGGHPEPIGGNLSAAARRVCETGAGMALATDGDADRLGVLDRKGEFVSAHRILALLVLHAFRVRGASGGIGKTFSTSLLIDRIGASLGAKVYETEIGFKYIADLMISGKVAVGGEESGGYGFAFHLPERDGTLAGLLLLENLAKTGRTLETALRDLDREFGRFEYGRRDVYRPVADIRRFLASVAAAPPAKIAGERVTGCREKDGVKLLLGSRGWLLLRLSGTEPMIRLYCEHEDGRLVEAILARAEERLNRFS